MALVAGMLTIPSMTTASAATETDTYVVLPNDGASHAQARAAVAAAGGQVVEEVAEIGAVIATSNRADVAAVADAQAGVAGVATNTVVGTLPKTDTANAEVQAEAKAQGAKAQNTHHGKNPKAEPLSDVQWDMRMIDATPEGSYREQPGRKGVLVGVLDSGIDGSHPDIASNFNKKLSRNFVTDIPDLDGPCEHPSCVDPVDEDDDGHGTHVAGEIGAPINGVGMAGVAPKVTLVNIRVGQDAGFIFLEPAVKALVYAGKIGVDVINMSFFIDPWLFNCQANPADSPTEQAEQRTIVTATQRAIDFAHRRGVTLVAALGNEHSDIGNPPPDTISPDFPLNTSKTRTIDNATCLTMPTEANHVISVASIGPSGKKSDFSNHGLEQNDVSAPGGFFRDFITDPLKNRKPENLILGPMPHNVALLSGAIDLTTGESTNPLVIAQCSAPGPDNCAYWQYLQGTSMASPHAAGVAALIVSEFGHGGKDISMDPDRVEQILRRTATDVACPAPVITYALERPGDPTYDAPCVGSAARNSIYGSGIVNALRAVQGGRHNHD
jgi:subtilisin family serine protease